MKLWRTDDRVPFGLLPALGAAALTLGVSPEAGAEITAESFGAHVTLTSDYVFRGVSQTREDPAIQGGFDFHHDIGFYAGVWGSSVDFPSNAMRENSRNLQLDYYIGYSRDIVGDWAADLGVIRYTYPGSSGFDYDYTEVALSGHFRDLVSVAVSYTDDAFGRGDRGMTYEATAHYPLPAEFSVGAGLGYYDLDSPFASNYLYWDVGLSRTLGHFTFDLGYFDTDSKGTDIWGDLAGERLVLSITAGL